MADPGTHAVEWDALVARVQRQVYEADAIPLLYPEARLVTVLGSGRDDLTETYPIHWVIKSPWGDLRV